MIVKHRRGTSKEWLELDLIPEEGELVIEECTNGLVKCKIGNGRTKFSKLPYIDEDTRLSLLQEIAEARSTLETKLSSVETDLSTALEDVEKTLLNVVTSNLETLANDINLINTSIRSDFDKSLKTAINSTKTETANAIKAVSEKSESNFALLEDSLNSEIKIREEAIKDLTDSVVLNNEAFTNSLKEATTKLTKDLTATVENKTAALSNTTKALEAKLTAVTDDFNQRLSEQTADLTQIIVDSVDTLADDHQVKITRLDSKVTAAEQDLGKLSITVISNKNMTDSAIKKANSRIDSITSTFDTELVGLSNDLTNKLQESLGDVTAEFNDKLKEANAATKALENNLEEESRKYTKDISDLRTSTNSELSNIKKAIITTNDTINAIAENHNATKEAFDKKLTDLRDFAIEVDQTLLSDFNEKLVDASNDLHDELSNDIRNVVYNQSIINTNVSGAIKNLTEDIDANKVAIEASLVAESDARKKDFTTLQQNIKEAKSAVSEELHNKISTEAYKLDTRLSTEVDKLSDYVEDLYNKIADNENTFDTKLIEQHNKVSKNISDVAVKATTDLTKLADQLNDAKDTFEIKLKNHADATSSKISEISDKIVSLDEVESRVATAIEAVEESLSSQAIDFNDKLNNAVSDLAADYTNALNTTKEALSKDLSDAIATKDKELTDIQHNANVVAALNNRRFIDINNQLEDLNMIKDSILEDIEVLEKNQEDSSAKILKIYIDAVEESLTDTISNVNYDLLTTISENKATSELNFMDVRAGIKGLKEDLTKHALENTNQFNEVSNTISKNKTDVEAALKDTTKAIGDLDTRIIDTNDKLAAQTARVDTLINPPDSGISADAELLDVRIGYKGDTYGTAGEAVRAIGYDVKALRDSLAQYIDTQAIDGLYYDYAGEVGLQQPYMLYLTAGGEVIQESGVQIISGAGGGGGGGSASSALKISYITTSPVVTTVNDELKLLFTFSGTDASGDVIQEASATWKVNGNIVAYSTIKDGGNEFDITKHLTIGTNKVLLVVTDDAGSTTTKSWTVDQKELSISSDFDDKVTYPANTEIVFSYTPEGSMDKVAIFKLNGEEIDRVNTLTTDVSGIPRTYRIPAQAHGSHLLEVYLEAEINETKITSNKVTKDLLVYDAKGAFPIIGTQASSLDIKQYSTANIVYTVYDPASETPTVNIEVDGIEVSTVTISANPKYNNTPTGVYSYTGTEAGKHTIKIICGTQAKTISVNVEKLDINVSPVTAGLAFDFNPVGRSNGDLANRLWSYENVHMTVSNNFDWVNGGYIVDEAGDACFCIKAGSTATIDYKLFADDAKKLGKEFKLVFKTKNVANPDAVFLSCVDNTTDKNHIGIKMGVQGAYVYGQNGSLDLAYSEEDVIEFEFNISKDSEKVPMVMGYEDGVPSRPMVYSSAYNFKQRNPKDIVIGSPDCDVYIYRFKVYNTSLTNVDILNNFIADARTTAEMIDRYNRNQIYDENRKLTPDVLAQKCPWLRIYKVSAPHFTNNKSDKVSNTTIQQIYKNGDPVLDNWTCYNAQHSGQGTSSNNYGAAGRNLDFIMNKDTSYFELGDGSTAKEITLTRESVPVAYLNAKVNIASSNNITNAILANRYNRFNPYRRPFVERDGIVTDYIKDTMEFHNCVIFIQETDPKLSTHREFADTDWHFYAIGNIGDSKKTDNTRATDPDDKYECCVEIMDVTLPLSDFPADTMMNAMSYTEDEETRERIYTWAKDSNLGILYEKQEDGTYELTKDTTVDLSKTYYVDILVHDDFSEDYTYGWRYISDDEDPDIVATCKNAWIEFYRFVTTSTDTEFKNNLKNYFVINSALYYYLFTTRYCMVDNRAKNTFWHYGKSADGTRKWDLCWDYDNDTALGLNNYGKQVYRYGLEDIDVDASGNEIFREMDSTFFCRLRDNFKDELESLYKELESQNAWHAESFIEECDNMQNEFPEELWRLDIDRKYLRTYTSSFINGKGDSQFLVNMCNGRMKYHRRQWERNQEQYMASKYKTIRASSDNYHANFRFEAPSESSGAVVPANYALTLTPAAYIYLTVAYSNGISTVRVTDANINKEVTVPYESRFATDIVNVYCASAIRDFGDLSVSYPSTVGIGNASRVKRLILGNDTTGYDNSNFTTLTTNTNPLLEELDVTNISGLTQSLELDTLVNLKSLKAFGTNIPSATFAAGGKLEYAELPAVNSITLKNLNKLSSANFKLSDYSNVTSIVVENCPLIDVANLINSCNINILHSVRLTDVSLGTLSYKDDFEDKFFKFKGLSVSGDETPNAILTGTVHFDSLTGSQFNELKVRYPQLIVTYNNLQSTLVFKDTDLETTLYQSESLNAADCQNPVHYDDSPIPAGKIAKPIKIEDVEFYYNFLGWSTSKNIIVSEETGLTDEIREQFRYEAVKHIEGDRVLYPVFEAIRQSYEIKFINATTVVKTITLLYGSEITDADLPDEPQKSDTYYPDFYEFVTWTTLSGKPIGKVEGPTEYYAQYAVLDDKWYILGTTDVDGISYNTQEGTMSFTRCINRYNSAVKIPNDMSMGSDFKIVGIGGFNDYNYNSSTDEVSLEIVKLPEYLLEIFNGCFSNCKSLTEVILPSGLQTIGTTAFKNCAKLTNIYIPASVNTIGEAAFAQCPLELIEVETSDSPNYIVNQGCLIETASGKLIQGSMSADTSIPQDGTVHSLGQFCFANTNINYAVIPYGVSSIPTDAFSNCKYLTTAEIPATVESLGATCFAWCNMLSYVRLEEGLRTISTFVFDASALTDVTIPSTVETILEKAFGDTPSLHSVTFNKQEVNGVARMPSIHHNAFQNSGTTEQPIVFTIPWTMEQHRDTFRGTYTDVFGTWHNKDIFFGASIGSKLRFVDADGNTIAEIEKTMEEQDDVYV